MSGQSGSPRTGFPATRRSRSAGIPGYRQQRRKSRFGEGLRVCKVFAKILGDFGGRHSNLREAGNGENRQSVVFSSTDRKFDVDGIITGSKHRTTQILVAEPIVSNLFAGQNHATISYGHYTRTGSLFGGEDDDLGLAYCLIKAINTKRAVEKINCTVTISMFEIKGDEIRDLQVVDERIKPPTYTKRKKTNEIVIEGLAEKVINSNGDSLVITNCLNNLPTDVETTIVCRIRVARYFGVSKTISYVDLVDCRWEDPSFLNMVRCLQAEDLENAFSTGLLAKLCENVVRNVETGLSFIACLSSHLTEISVSLSAMKLGQDLFNVRRENSPSISPGGSPTNQEGTPIDFLSRSPPVSPTASPSGMPSPYVVENSYAVEVERKLHISEGRLQASQQLVSLLENELKEKNNELIEEKKSRILAEQSKQDVENRAKVLEERIDFETKKLCELKEEVRVKEEEVKSVKIANYELTQDLRKHNQCIQSLEKDKERYQSQISFVTKALAEKRYDTELWGRLRLYLALPEAPPFIPKKRTGSPKSRPRGYSILSQSSARSSSRTHTTPNPRYNRALTTTYTAPFQNGNGAIDSPKPKKNSVVNRPTLFNSGPNGIKRPAAGSISPNFVREASSASKSPPQNTRRLLNTYTYTRPRKTKSPPAQLRNTVIEVPQKNS